MIKTTFEPDSELLKFANWFSKNHKTLSVGEYFSDDKKYHISYLDRIVLHSGSISETGARVSDTTGRIELDKTKISDEKFTHDFIFFLIIWCVVKFDCVKSNNLSDMSVDKIALDYCSGIGLSTKDIINGVHGLIPIHLHEQNRIDNLKKYLENGKRIG